MNDLDDEHLGFIRKALILGSEIPVVGTITALVLENLPSPTERAHARTIQSLQRTVHELREVVTETEWRRAEGTEEFDAAFVRSIRIAEEAFADEKRQLVWFALMNGWVRVNGDPERARFLKLVARYELEHFVALKKIQSSVGESPSWHKVSTELVELIGGDRHVAMAYLQEFDSDGLIRLYDQPELHRDSVMTTRIALWTDVADRFLAFVCRPGEREDE